MKRLSILFFGIFLIELSSCGKKAATEGAKPDAAIPVTVQVVQEGDPIYYDNFPGTIVALNEVTLLAQVNGYVTGIFFKEGEIVKKGQKLYEIDRIRYQAAYDQALANLRIAEANVEKAQRDADRYNRLLKQDAVARQIAENAETDLRNAQLQVTSAQANLTTARTNLSYSVILAPFTGTIGISQVKMGALVNQGQTLLNTISSDNPMAVDFEVDEKTMVRFYNLPKQKTTSDSTFRLILPGGIKYDTPGQLSVIDRAVNPQTGTIRIRLQFPNTEHLLRTGMSSTVQVLNKSGKRQLLVPSKSVIEQMGEYFVYVIKDNKAEQRKVSLGAVLQDQTIITTGLNAGEQIAVEGIQKLKNEAPVQTQPAKTASR
ncbi:efflux RND transporter periplasmic adaptor subunit [Cytophagaceae bacterium YF14B1]|uniref:Efflux RND transporter periplasmic adaptor subunit n=1 Tax=Xanthocytophaga flava TaxID=3048013 RepID=A0AAE3U9T9_9BACT|nr:efflux RND transporter periplasmic adaptor subunit [Xanthocytophaga flavus]MDJ1485459.1 efflux RND transporter periplasmic adaptor subunit [Xanthocytophaga flavus]